MTEAGRCGIELERRDEIFQRTLQYIKAAKPEASQQKHYDFASSVAYLVTNWQCHAKGPTAREQAVARTYRERLAQGRLFSYEQAVYILEDDKGLIFGPLRDIHHAVWRES